MEPAQWLELLAKCIFFPVTIISFLAVFTYCKYIHDRIQMRKCIENYNPKGVTYPHDYTRRHSWWEQHSSHRGSIPKIIVSPQIIVPDYADLEKGSPVGEVIHYQLNRRSSGIHLALPPRF